MPGKNAGRLSGHAEIRIRKVKAQMELNSVRDEKKTRSSTGTLVRSEHIPPPLINEKGEKVARDTEKQFITSLHWQSVITDEMLRTVPEGKWNSAGLLGRCVGIEVLQQGGWGPCEGSWEHQAASRQF